MARHNPDGMGYSDRTDYGDKIIHLKYPGLFSWLQGVLTGPLAGFLASYIAFFAIILLELLHFALRGDAITGPFLFYAATLFLVGAMLYALAFNLTYTVLRQLASLLSRLGNIWSFAVPGIVLFILYAQPLLSSDALANVFSPSIATLLAAVASLLVALPIIFLFPHLRGYNATFLFLSAIAARLIHGGCGMDTGFSPLLYLFCASQLTLTALLFFMALHMRHRLHLSSGYESTPVSPYLRYGILPVLFLLGAAILLPEIFARFPGWLEAIAGPGGALYFQRAIAPESLRITTTENPAELIAPGDFPGALYLVLLIQWTITAFRVDLRSRRSPGERKLALSISLTLLSMALSLFSVLYLAPRSAPSFAAELTESRYTLRLMRLAGLVLDRDRDGNSLWPGGDPDDGDPCVRRDFRNHCEWNDAGRPVLVPKNLSDPPDTSISETWKEEHFSLFTIAGVMPDNDWLESLEKSGFSVESGSIHLPSNDIGHNLRALFLNLDGMQEYMGARRASLFTELSMNGFRTVCGGFDGGHGYLSLKNPLQLDGGCQIYQDLSIPTPATTPGTTGEENRAEPYKNGLDRTVSAMLRILARYHEKHNILWIHYDAGTPDDSVAETISSTFASSSANHGSVNSRADKDFVAPAALFEQLKDHEIPRILEHGDLLLLFMDPANSLDAEAVHVSWPDAKRKRVSLPSPAESFRSIIGRLMGEKKRSEAPNRANTETDAGQIGFLYGHSLQRLYPTHSFVRRGNGILVFDSITGLTQSVGKDLNSNQKLQAEAGRNTKASLPPDGKNGAMTEQLNGPLPRSP